MATTTSYPNAPDVSADDYLVVGLATCFIKEEGEVHEVQILEPIPSAALEAIVKGIPTSYKLAWGTTLGAVLGDAPQGFAGGSSGAADKGTREPRPNRLDFLEQAQRPSGFPESAQFGDEFVPRAIAAARTYKRRELAKFHIPQGTTRDDFKYSTERKRMLNAKRVVTKEDNVKQHSHTHKVL